jgi:hypothetical protein
MTDQDMKQTKRKQDALWWEARLWEVADGEALTAKEAQALANWLVEPMLAPLP